MSANTMEQAYIFAAKNGNAKSFEELYKHHYQSVYAIALTTMRQKKDAEIVLRATFAAAWQEICTFDDTTEFGLWLRNIARGKCAELTASRQKTPQHSEETLLSDHELRDVVISTDLAMDVFRQVFQQGAELVTDATVASIPAPAETIPDIPASSVTQSLVPAGGASSAAGAASTAVKTGFPLWAKITAGAVAASVTVAGGIAAWNVFLKPKNDYSSAVVGTSAESSATNHSTTEMTGNKTEASTGSASEKQKTIQDIDPSDLPDDLTEFLQVFDFAFRSNDGEREFDCEDTDNVFDSFAKSIVGNPTCVKIDDYPGGDSVTSWSGPDPLGRHPNGWGYRLVPKTKTLWIMENVFNLSEDESLKMIEATKKADSSFYEYEDDGTDYYCNKISGVGGPGYVVTYETVKYDGEKYYIIYDCTDAVQYDGAKTVVYFAEMSLKETDGIKHWSLYRHSERIPDMYKADGGTDNTEDMDDISGWSSVYKRFIQNKEYLSSSDGWLSNDGLQDRLSKDLYPVFYLYDLNSDNTPELFMSFGYIAGSTPHNVYSVKNNKLVFLSSITPGGEMLIHNAESDNHGLFCGAGRQGFYSVQYWYMTGDTIENIEVLAEKVKNIANFNEGFDLTVFDQNLYATFMACTEEGEQYTEVSFRKGVNALPTYNRNDLESMDWNSFIAAYGY